MPLFPYNTHQFKDSLLELTRRAIIAIRDKRFDFEAKAKENRRDIRDLITDADLQAQELIASGLTVRFPNAGIVSEENLFIESKDGIVFTIDPLDGTKAFVRQESGNIAVMIGVLFENQVMSAFIGDIWTQEVFYYRPTSPNVHRLIDFNFPAPLYPFSQQKTADRCVLMFREDPYRIEGLNFPAFRDRFPKFHIDSGSIGISFTKLWKGEVGAIIVNVPYYTPWDLAPLVGISEKLGYRFYALENGGFEPIEIKIHLKIHDFHKLLLVCNPVLLQAFDMS